MNKLKKIPKFKDEEEEREFWTKSDSSEYINWKKSKKIGSAQANLKLKNNNCN